MYYFLANSSIAPAPSPVGYIESRCRISFDACSKVIRCNSTTNNINKSYNPPLIFSKVSPTYSGFRPLTGLILWGPDVGVSSVHPFPLAEVSVDGL
jgi:hypothetical protein